MEWYIAVTIFSIGIGLSIVAIIFAYKMLKEEEAKRTKNKKLTK